MKKMNVKNLKAGKTVYYVHALGEQSFVSKYIVTGRPVYHYYKNLPEYMDRKSDSLFAPSRFVFDGGRIAKMVDSFSLVDCNVERQNGYNKHRLFFKKKAADRYCELCKQCKIDYDKPSSNFCWDYPLELDDPYYDCDGMFDEE